MKIIIYLLMGMIMLSCNSNESNEITSEKDKDEVKDTIEVSDEMNNMEVEETDTSQLGKEFDLLLEITFAPELRKTQNDAIAFLNKKGIEFEENFSPEESEYTLWITLKSDNGKNKVELNYTYQESTEEFINFRNIVSVIEPHLRKPLINRLKKLCDDNLGVEAFHYNKSYGEKGWLWYNWDAKETVQTVVVETNGKSNWIEIAHYNFIYVTKEELGD